MNIQKKNTTGITLIALVITIIVLLILAGVTIVTLTGDNGLITKSNNAQKETLKAEGLEKLQVEIAGSYDNNGQIDINQLKTNLQHINGITTENDEPITNNTEIKLPILVKINGNQYLINLNGTTRAKYGIDEYDISTHPETYYGHYVTNYNSPNDAGIVNANGQLGKWQIFMSDDTNIYLIASNGIKAEYIGKKNNKEFGYNSSESTTIWFTDDILSQYNANNTRTDIPEILSRLDKQNIYHKWINTTSNQTKNYNNEKAVASMLDVDVWNGYNNTTYAKYVIGGPTLEMLCKAYNDSHTGDKLEALETYNNGYKIKKGTDDPANSVSELKTGAKNTLVDNMYLKQYWIASPSASWGNWLMSGSNTGIGCAGYSFSYPTYVFLPLVCLKSDVHLIQNSDGQTYFLELN